MVPKGGDGGGLDGEGCLVVCREWCVSLRVPSPRWSVDRGKPYNRKRRRQEVAKLTRFPFSSTPYYSDFRNQGWVVVLLS